jgi:hypothetical protein
MGFAFKEVLPIAVPIAMLNVFFLWTSRVLLALDGINVFPCAPSLCYYSSLGYVLDKGVIQMVNVAFGVNYLANRTGNSRNGEFVIDIISIFCVLVLFVAFYRRYSGRGKPLALMKAIQLVDLCVLPLGIEIWLGDHIIGTHYLNWTVITVQQYLGPLSRISNLDFLYASFAVLVLASLSIRVYRSRIKPQTGISPSPAIVAPDGHS